MEPNRHVGLLRSDTKSDFLFVEVKPFEMKLQ